MTIYGKCKIYKIIYYALISVRFYRKVNKVNACKEGRVRQDI